jgi:hypothetical protein
MHQTLPRSHHNNSSTRPPNTHPTTANPPTNKRNTWTKNRDEKTHATIENNITPTNNCRIQDELIATKIVLWNANGLAQHTEEVKNYIQNQQVDDMLISETHKREAILKSKITQSMTTPRWHCAWRHCNTHQNSIKHYLHGHYSLEHLQATSIAVEDWVGPLTIAAIYCPPKHTIKADQFRHVCTSLGHSFLAGGDYNAKHTHWGSRLIAPEDASYWKPCKRRI